MTAIRCPWCGRGVRLRPDDGALYRHDNRNHSGYCKGSLMPVSSSSEQEARR